MTEDNISILEHEILHTLYTKPTIVLTKHRSQDNEYVPIYKRQYGTAYLEFGVLVDILNNPDKYLEKPDGITFLNQLTVNNDSVNITKYNWFEVSDAIEVLVLNEHIKDSLPDNIFESSEKRYIHLLPKGAIDYRDGFYLKKLKKDTIEDIHYKVSKIDYTLKRYLILYDILKILIGAIIGAAITLLVKGIQ